MIKPVCKRAAIKIEYGKKNKKEHPVIKRDVLFLARIFKYMRYGLVI